MKIIKKMGIGSIILLAINSIIGSGIFLTPGNVVKMVGSWTPLVYLSAGIFASFLALTFANASRYVDKPGAAYAYAHAAFGDTVGFYIGITRYVAACIAWGVMVTAVVKTGLGILGIPTTFNAMTLGFGILMVILFLLNRFGLRLLTFVNNISTVGKLTALVVMIGSGVMILMSRGSQFNNVYGYMESNNIQSMNMQLFVMAVVSAVYAFTGFENIASGSKDMKDPDKNLPRAIPIAMGIIITIYLSIVSVAMFVDPITLATSSDVVVLASLFQNPVIHNVIVVGALISMFGITVASSFHTPRALEAIAQTGQVPRVFSKRLDNGFPLPAFVLTCIIAVLIPMAFQYDMNDIMIISAVSRFLQFLIVPICVIMFHYDLSKETFTTVKKKFVLDVIISSVALILTVILLAKFDWVGQFSYIDSLGIRNPNWFAIGAMVLGYLLVPLVLLFKLKKNPIKSSK